LDISAAKGSKLGQSESQLRDALATADAVAPCVLWVDEVEKGVGGYASSAATDGGTTLGMVGTLLTWWQEHKSPVLTFATCNDFAKLPDEMTRPGRFDERFFFDLPCDSEREEIAKIHLEILGCKLENLPALVNLTADWTPAEIEHLIKKVARRTGRKPTMGMYDICSREIKPISKRANIQALREWAKENLTPANDVQEEATGRKINMRSNRNAN
jgi:SpoVK/Ycf46/Vps4 family AAA+-type ATPase